MINKIYEKCLTGVVDHSSASNKIRQTVLEFRNVFIPKSMLYGQLDENYINANVKYLDNVKEDDKDQLNDSDVIEKYIFFNDIKKYSLNLSFFIEKKNKVLQILNQLKEGCKYNLNEVLFSYKLCENFFANLNIDLNVCVEVKEKLLSYLKKRREFYIYNNNVNDLFFKAFKGVKRIKSIKDYLFWNYSFNDEIYDKFKIFFAVTSEFYVYVSNVVL